METNPKTFSFPSPVLRLESQMRQHYVPIPTDIVQELEGSGTSRVIATLNGTPFRRALLGRKDGERFVFVSLTMLKSIDARLGDIVMVDIRSDPEPDRIDLGEEFEEVLAQDKAAADRFFAMTPGRQRGLAHYVTSGKRIETRVKRALEIARKLRTNTLYGDTTRD